MSRRQFFEDMRRRDGRTSVSSSGCGSPRGRSGSNAADTPNSAKRRNTGSQGDTAGGVVQELYTPLRQPPSSHGSQHSTPQNDTKRDSTGICTDAYREGRLSGMSPTPLKQNATASNAKGNTGDRSRSNTAPYSGHGSAAIPAPVLHPSQLSSGRRQSESSVGTTSTFPMAQQQSPSHPPTLSGDGGSGGGSALRSPPTGTSPRNIASQSLQSDGKDHPLSRGSTHGHDLFIPAVVSTPGRSSATRHPQINASRTPPGRSPGNISSLAADGTPIPYSLDTPDHRSLRGSVLPRSRSPAANSPYTPSAEMRLNLDDSAVDVVTPKRPQDRSTDSGSRDRACSVSRIEGTLVALQMDLANEKRNNIEAELTISALRREVESLRTENAVLSAAAASGERRSGVSGRPGNGDATSATYVEELELQVERLNKTLDAKQRELDSKEERVRLLEHKLADQLLMGGPFGGMAVTPAMMATFAQQQQHVQVASQRYHPQQQQQQSSADRAHLRSSPSSAAADIPSTVFLRAGDSVGHSPGPKAAVVANTSDLQPISRNGDPTAMERRVQAMHAASSARGASPAAVPPEKEGPPRTASPKKRSSTAAARRPSVRRRDSNASVASRTGQVPSRPRAGSATGRSSAPRVRSGSVMSARPVPTQRDRRASAPTFPAVKRKNSTSTVLNGTHNSASPMPRAGGPGTPKRGDSSARRNSSPVTSQPRRPSVTRRGSVRSTGTAGGGGHAHSLPPSSLQAPATTVTTTGFANSTAYQKPPGLRSMMGSQPRTSPARSATASLRSGTSTRSRPRIMYDDRGNMSTMQGTTTTVVFRSSSTDGRSVSVPGPYGMDYSRWRPNSGRDAPLVPKPVEDAPTGDSDGLAPTSGISGLDTA